MNENHPTSLPPLRGGILIGGASTRMGTPKHLLIIGGRTMLDSLCEVLAPFVTDTALIGQAHLPDGASVVEQLTDAAGVPGPLGGLLAALRADRQRAWLIVACDMPLISPDALRWLIGQRSASRAAVLPRTADGRVQPLLAVYEPSILPHVERLAASGRLAVRHLAEAGDVFTPQVPPELAAAWDNINTPEELRALQQRIAGCDD